MNVPIIGNIIDGVSGFFKKREERKKAVETAKIKVKAAKNKAENDLELTDAEWESLAVNKQDTTWKDEYLTVVVTAPLITILVGGIYAAFTGDASLLEGTKLALREMREVGVDLGELMYAVVLAGVGLKVWRSA